jgi:CRISPR-associated protein Csb2
MLALEVEFLTGRYAATDFRDRDGAEWPPHPSRLFSAFVAAAYESGLGESARAALLWLESLPPPHIYADEAPAVQSPVTAYVPVNDPAGAPLPQRAERQPRSFPSVVPHARAVGESPVAYFVWPEAWPDEVLRRLLDAVAENVTYLGSSRSLVRVRLADHVPAPNWIPDEEGDALLRVPGKGRLERLEWHYQNGLRPPAGAFQRYTRGPSWQEVAAPESAFDEMVVYRLGGPVTMEIETTLKLTESLRAAAMRRVQDAVGVVPELLSGHDDQGRPSRKTHAAYVALPFVDETRVHADGHVLGLAVVLPRGLPAQQRRRLIRPLVGLDHLNVSGVGRLELQRLTPDMPEPQVNLREWVWARLARRWASVTPVLLDRFPKRSGRGLGKVFARSCEHVGLPHPVEVLAEHHSPLFGVEPSSRFVTQRATPGGPKARLFTHVTLTFAEPVRGPVLLGAGRYFGLGLLRPLQEEGQP